MSRRGDSSQGQPGSSTGHGTPAKDLDSLLLSDLSKTVENLLGLYFPEERWRDLQRALSSCAGEFGFEDTAACAKWLASSVLTRPQIETLASHLTVGETYFFRDRLCFDFLEERLLPELIRARSSAGRYLRIWSAGCCTGEEPYSISILLNKLITVKDDWNISILGTDVNPIFLAKAVAGVYGDWSFRDAPKWITGKYFTRTRENCFELVPEARKHVVFGYHNLSENTYPSPLTATQAMDLILCRNVLMYLAPDHQRRVATKLSECLVEGGWLIVSPSEVSDALFSGLVPVRYKGATFYRKGPEAESKTRGFAGKEAAQFIHRAPLPEWKPSEQPLQVEPHNAGVAAPPLLAEEQMSPEGPDRFEEALLLYEKGAYAEAKEDLTFLLYENPGEARAAALLARILANEGKLTEALSLCQQAVAADRCDPGRYYLLANILQEQGRSREAAAELKKALYMDQDFVPAHFLLGNLALMEGNRKESARHFKNAIIVLSHRHPEDVIPGAEGLTAGRLMEIIRSTGFEDET